MFIDEWSCPVQRDEFPLEVCKICIKARSIHNESTKIKVPENGRKDKTEEDLMEISNMIEEVENEEKRTEEKEHVREELNKKFHEGELSVDEYIKKRKELPKVSK